MIVCVNPSNSTLACPFQSSNYSQLCGIIYAEANEVVIINNRGIVDSHGFYQCRLVYLTDLQYQLVLCPNFEFFIDEHSVLRAKDTLCKAESEPTALKDCTKRDTNCYKSFLIWNPQRLV